MTDRSRFQTSESKQTDRLLTVLRGICGKTPHIIKETPEDHNM